MAKSLPPDQLRRLHQSLLQAFPDRSDFAQFLLFQLGVDLEEISSSKAGMSTIHFEVLRWFQARNRLEELVQKANAERPGNLELAALYAEIKVREPAMPPLQPDQTRPAIAKPEKSFWQQVPGWLYGLLGVMFLALLAWTGVQLAGSGDGDGVVEATRPGDESSTVVVIENAATITPFPDPLATYTDQPAPMPSPTLDTNGPPLVAELGESWIRPADGMEMVFVPAGSFMMGSEVTDPDADEDEFPRHQVRLDAFWIDQTEVTNAQFAAFLNENGNQEGGGVPWLNLGDANAHITREGNAFQVENFYTDYPVILVNWYGAAAYCDWAGGRLPTEAEWEYAARGPAGNLYPWGNDQPTCLLAGYGLCVGTNMMAVGSFSEGASWVGALDMAGNVWEWVSDEYDPDYYANSPAENPSNEAASGRKVRRGGGWSSLPDSLRGAARENDSANNRFNHVGFRCVIPQT